MLDREATPLRPHTLTTATRLSTAPPAALPAGGDLRPRRDGVAYRFTSGRGSELLAAELGTFAGTLVGDGYSGNRAAADKVVGEIVTAGCVWVDLDNRLASEDRAFGFEAGVRLHVFRLISVGAMYSMIEEDDLVAVSARLAF